MVYSICGLCSERTKEEVGIDVGLLLEPVLGLGEVGGTLIGGEISSVSKSLGCVFRNNDGCDA